MLSIRSKRNSFAVDGCRYIAGDLRAVVGTISPAGGSTAKCCRSNGVRSIGKGARSRLDPGTTKNREGRTFPFTAALEQLLKDQLVEHERLKRETGGASSRTCSIVRRCSPDGTPMPAADQFRRAWRTACRAAGVPGRILHDFRRTAVRNLERVGVPRSAAMAMVGHKTESIYRRYAIVDAGVLREAAAKIDRAADTLGGELGTLSGHTDA